MRRIIIILAMLFLIAAVWNTAAAAEEPRPVVMISEVMASNDSVATYQGAGYSDWIEVYNAGSESVDLGGWGLSDNPEKAGKWQFPAGTILRAGEYRVVVCDKDTARNNAGEPHADFTLGRKGGEVITLTDPEGNVHDTMTLPEMWTNISYGRNLSDGRLVYFDPATPFAANGAGFGGFAAAPSFSAEPGFYDAAQYLRINTADGTRVYYTTDGSEPTTDDTLYSGETLEVKYTAVIRARAFGDGDIRPSDTLAGTFFIIAHHSGPVVAVTVDPDDRWDGERGMLTVGDNVTKKAGQLPFKNTVYRKVKDSGVKYESYVEMYDDEGKQIISQGADISLTGDYSLDMPQKSFKFKAKSKYGEKSFKAKLFADRDYEEYKSFVLRNSGNDCMFTRLADGFQSRLMDYCGSSVAHQAWKPYAVYLNGTYWGHMNLRERVDKYMVAQFEGLDLDDADSLDLLTANGSVKSGSNKEYKEMIKKIKAGKPAKKQADLQYILDNVDVDNLFEYLALEMFVGNSDIGNTRYYRLKGPDSKWRWIWYDADYGLFMSNFDSPKSYTKAKGMGQQNIDNTIFRKLLSVPEYKDRFLRKLGDVFQFMTTERMLKILQPLVEEIAPEMELHWARWGGENDRMVQSDVPITVDGAYRYWEKRVERLRNVCRKRPTYLWEMVQKAFNLTDAQTVEYLGDKPEMPADAV